MCSSYIISAYPMGKARGLQIQKKKKIMTIWIKGTSEFITMKEMRQGNICYNVHVGLVA